MEVSSVCQICAENYTSELRKKTNDLKDKISDHIKEDTKEVNQLKSKAEEEIPNEEKETLYESIDDLEKNILNKIEDILNDILPTAFAIIKETAKRFTENNEIEVTATSFDKDLAAEKDFVTIKGDKAIYQNKWIAAGNEITWNMIHYDVQLIGGIVKHQGKIAEMQTGEGKTLSATLPVFLNALSGRGVHLITVNDYLAKRDCEWMGAIFQFHGLSID